METMADLRDEIARLKQANVAALVENKRLSTAEQRVVALIKLNKKLQEENSDLRKENLRIQQLNSFDQHKMCGDKVTYKKRHVAKNIAKNRGQRAYKCPVCEFWHLTTKGAIPKRGNDEPAQPWRTG